MKTAIASRDNSENARVDAHFGRCGFFFIFDDTTGEHEVAENPARHDPGCRGEKIVEFLRMKEVLRVVAGDFGSHSQQLMTRHGIQMVIQPDPARSVADIIHRLKENAKTAPSCR